MTVKVKSFRQVRQSVGNVVDTLQMGRTQDAIRDLQTNLNKALVQLQTKYLTKTLTADLAAATDPITDLTVTVIPGAIYRITLQMHAITQANVEVLCNVRDKGIALGSDILMRRTWHVAGSLKRQTACSQIVHQMVGSEITVDVVGATATELLLGNDSFEETFILVEELPNHISVETFT